MFLSQYLLSLIPTNKLSALQWGLCITPAMPVKCYQIDLGNEANYAFSSITWHRDSPPAAAAKSLQLCPTLCDPIDGSPPGSPVPGILQARTLEWVTISFSNAWTWKVKVKSLSRVRLFITPWAATYQAPPSMGFFRRESWSGVPLPSPHPNLKKGI